VHFAFIGQAAVFWRWQFLLTVLPLGRTRESTEWRLTRGAEVVKTSSAPKPGTEVWLMTSKPRKRRESCTTGEWSEVVMIILRIFVQVSDILRDWLGGHGGALK
jgi:hypothetical protein